MSTTVRRILAVAAVLASVAAVPAAAQTKPAPAAPRPAAKTPAVAQAPRSPQPDRFDKLADAAHAAREAGRLEEAVALYGKALQLRPSWTEGQWYLGTMYYEMDRYTEGRNAFRAVTADQPNNGPAHGFKGLCEFQLKNYEGALSDLMRAKQLGLGGNRELEGSVHYYLGITATRLGQYDLALMQLQWFSQRANDSPRVIEAFGLAALRMPLLPAELPPDRREMVLLAGRGSFYQAAPVNGPAKPAFDELVSRFPDSPNVHHAYGVFLLRDDPDRAIEEFKKELKQSPGHVLSMLQIAFEYIKRSDWEAAKPWAEQAVANAPTDFVGRRALGQVLFELGDTAGAIEHLERGVKLAPDSPSLHFVLARAYQKAGRAADAERERGEFQRLQRQTRSAQFGEQSVGGQEPAEPQ